MKNPKNKKTIYDTAYDTLYCVRHKERDHAFIENGEYWKPTFANKHYHVGKDCILMRNPLFNASDMDVGPELLAPKDVKKFINKHIV